MEGIVAEPCKEIAKGCCPRCGAEDALRIGQLSYRGSLRWYESVSCAVCGLQREADGVGFPPDEIRQRIADSSGLWEVRLLELSSKAMAAKVIRDALSMKVRDALEVFSKQSGIVYVGTFEEANWIAGLLSEAGESPSVEKLD
jgi:hypothetical protein